MSGSPPPWPKSFSRDKKAKKAIINWARDKFGEHEYREANLEAMRYSKPLKVRAITPTKPMKPGRGRPRKGKGELRYPLRYPLSESERAARSNLSFMPDLVNMYSWYLKLFKDHYLPAPEKQPRQELIKGLARRCAATYFYEMLRDDKNYFLTEPVFDLSLKSPSKLSSKQKKMKAKIAEAADWTETEWLEAWETSLAARIAKWSRRPSRAKKNLP
jgi:hypothetical protein